MAVALTSLTVPTCETQLEWFALVVKPRHEKAAAEILSGKGFETFLPLHPRVHRYDGRHREYRVPLFPGYLFCRFDPEASMPVLTTPSVSRVAGAGRRPLPVDAAELESLRIVAASPFRLTPHPHLETGSKVRIREGPLCGSSRNSLGREGFPEARAFDHDAAALGGRSSRPRPSERRMKGGRSLR
jgi:transcriptional antiterminator NusG